MHGNGDAINTFSHNILLCAR